MGLGMDPPGVGCRQPVTLPVQGEDLHRGDFEFLVVSYITALLVGAVDAVDNPRKSLSARQRDCWRAVDSSIITRGGFVDYSEAGSYPQPDPQLWAVGCPHLLWITFTPVS